jgi:hypothetical protein
LIVRLLSATAAFLAAASAAAQIPQDEYLRYVPLTYPSLVRETQASRRFAIYGDRDGAAYRDASPRDGIDDARAAWLNALAVKSAPVMVRNSHQFPIDFRRLAARPSFGLHVDTWALARDETSFIGGTTIPLGELADRPCTEPRGPPGAASGRLGPRRGLGPPRGPGAF